MISFIGRRTRRYRARQPVIGSHGGLDAHPAAPGHRLRARSRRVRGERGDRAGEDRLRAAVRRASRSGSSSSRPTRSTTPTTRCCGAATCCTGTLPVFEGFRVPDRAPAGDRRRRRAVAVRRAAATALWVAMILASFLCAGRRASTGSAGSPSTPLVGRGRGGAAADPLRLRVPGRARLHRHPVHGAGRVGGGARGGARRGAARRCCCCSRWPGMLRPRRGCWRRCTGCGWRGRRRWRRAVRATRRSPRSARWCGRGRLRWSPATRCSRCTTRAGSAEDLGPPAPLSRAADARSRTFFAEPRQAAGARGRGGRASALGVVIVARARMLMPLVLLVAGVVTFVLIGVAGRVGDRALPGRRRRSR